ncbi:probable 28S ribosomal protein S6, mitochondrial [Ctenocephalides felis]|uniref:probable 28S ribosomal protein S6, mitochondrial n=1 Tax=Ctenocephalides felis TaxID=7515 RepID=UPI000E6E4BE4|nr:probable 28S ribosomal protein S6, mitochondrial [Ctenocephalides felis]XP_026474732.1 probable 28S ribosomal protein S6, mitochondrial [Ctenocephalides felis]
MITYELSLILRNMPRNEIFSTLKRTAESIFDKGGVIRKIENLGARDLPFKMSEHGQVYRQGNYFLMTFDSPPNAISDLHEGYSRDIDIIRKCIYKTQDSVVESCTLEEELLPPAYRTEVQALIAQAKKSPNRKLKLKSVLDYYPFQR